MPNLIDFLDRIAALRGFPREDRVRAGIEELRLIYEQIPAWIEKPPEPPKQG